MWALDVVAGDGVGSDTTFYLIAGEWTVGRKHCHFNFRADSSISRTHALIRVGALTSEQLEDPLTRPPLELVDNNSRFGSFVNQEQSYETRRLYHGDRISFGAKKTVLRVRYQVFVLVASRIQRVNRSHLNDACKRIGMHLVPEATKDATHCIMDSGRIVATVKVLWALVYNQPVVCTAWIYAVLNRTSLSDPLPRCEDFLPSDPSIPSFEDKYLPNALRKTLYQGYAVVFLAPQSMEELILAMAGVVVAAYKNFDDDDKLVHELKFLASNKRLLLVEPEQATAFSGTAGQSEQQASTFKEHLYCVDVVERRVELFKSMGALFTSVQELAASVIFVKAPTTPDDSTFNNALAKYAGPSAQVTSFPEHLSLQSISVRERKDTALKSNLEVNVEDFSVDDIAKSTIKKDVEQLTDLQHGSDQTKRNVTNMNIFTETTKGQATLASSGNALDLKPEKAKGVDLSAWKSSRVLRLHEVKTEPLDNNTSKAIVIDCELIVKKRRPTLSDKSEENYLVNYKRFNKGNGYGSRSSITSLFPKKTVMSVAANADRVVPQEDFEIMEEQERIAEELFALGEGRTKTKLFD